jgi:archaellum component FlaC
MQEMTNLLFDSTEESKKTLEEMWKYIEDILSPYDLVPKKDNITNDQILKLYFELSEVDEVFRQLAQIVILKEEVDKLKADSVRL